MKQPVSDLFPETLLVSLDQGHIFTTSRKVAEHFGKSHKNVLQSIDLLLAEISRLNFQPPNEISRLNFEPPNEISLSNFGQPNTDRGLKIETTISHIGRRNFEPSTYTDQRGKTYPEYHISHDGFSLLAMGFTGKEALVWKLKFLAAFNAMQAQINVMRDRYVGAIDILCPPLRPTVERTQSAQGRTAIASVIGKSCASVTYYRTKARRLGLLGDRT